MSIQKGLSAAGMVGRLGAIVAVLLVANLAAADIGDAALTFTIAALAWLATRTGRHPRPTRSITTPGMAARPKRSRVDLGKEAVSAQVCISYLYAGEGELACWQAFNSTGAEIGRGRSQASAAALVVSPLAAQKHSATWYSPRCRSPPPRTELDNSEFYVRSITVVYADDTQTSFGGVNTGAAGWAGAVLDGIQLRNPVSGRGRTFRRRAASSSTTRSAAPARGATTRAARSSSPRNSPPPSPGKTSKARSRWRVSRRSSISARGADTASTTRGRSCPAQASRSRKSDGVSGSRLHTRPDTEST